MDDQDWEPVVVRRGRAASLRSSPAATSTSHPRPHAGAGAPVRLSGEAAHLAKVERADVPTPLRALSPNTRFAMTSARVAAGMTQAQLNSRVALPVNSIRDFESGRAVPTPTQLDKLNRMLNVRLHYAHNKKTA